jgi:2-polyprenyl-3-methyl-5-hydroxy-6-metoxy-1,4-benzoquinol methylase
VSEHEVDMIVARLRDELKASAADADQKSSTWAARSQAERFWAVTADRPFLYRPGAWGRIRGTLLLPPKLVLRKLMRWYVEPALGQQRDYNSSVLKALDRLSERIDVAVSEFERELEQDRERAGEARLSLEGLERSAAETEERLLRVERRARRAPALPTPTASSPAPALPPKAPDYFAFEARMRGPRGVIRERQSGYLDQFREAAPVLDLGCGRGEFLELLRDAGVEARGIDLDEDMVEHCREEGLDVDVAEALTYLEALEDGSLGGIFCAHLVEHLSPPALFRLLELAAAKLRPGGAFVAETPNPLSLYALANFSADLSHDRPIHPGTLEFLVRQAGFREAKLRFLDPVPERERLRPVPLPAERAFEDTREALDANVDRLNDVVFGPQDYAVVART